MAPPRQTLLSPTLSAQVRHAVVTARVKRVSRSGARRFLARALAGEVGDPTKVRCASRAHQTWLMALPVLCSVRSIR